jgi:hypothetical protein
MKGNHDANSWQHFDKNGLARDELNYMLKAFVVSVKFDACFIGCSLSEINESFTKNA